jgi:hypothetical protein
MHGYYPGFPSWVRVSPQSAKSRTRITQAQVWHHCGAADLHFIDIYRSDLPA